MALQIGDKVPVAEVIIMGENGPEKKLLSDLCAGKKVVIFALPGAFTPTCSARHLPGYMDNYDAISAKGVDEIICISANDPFVMKAWGDANQVSGKITMVGDSLLAFGNASGLTFDASGFGLGIRLLRFAMVVNDNEVTKLQIEETPGHFDVSSAESILAAL